MFSSSNNASRDNSSKPNKSQSQSSGSGGLFGIPNPFSSNSSAAQPPPVYAQSSASSSPGRAGSTSVTVLTSVLVLAVLVAVILYVVYKYRQSHLDSVVLVDSPLKLYGMTEPKKVKKSELASTSIGQEYSYSFWLYLVDYDETSSDHRMLFMRTGDQDDLSSANPIVFMDGRTNRLYVSVRTNRSGSIDDLSDLVSDGKADPSSNFLTGVVEYIPLQRWVNVVVVLQDNLMTLFLDGDMYSVRNVHDIWDRSTSQNRPIMAASEGNVYIGPTSQNSSNVRGFISGVKYFNYALMGDSISAIYRYGPELKTFMSRFAYSRKYGFQSPIYRLDSDEKEDKED